MKNLFRMTITAALCATALCQAETTDKGLLPKGPIPAKAPDFAKWTVTITGKRGEAVASSTTEADAKADAAKASKTIVSVTKTLPVRLITTTGPKGDSVLWCVGTFQVHEGSGFRKPTLYSAASEIYIDFSNSDFPELQWISDNNFVGVQKIEDQEYLVFRVKSANVPETDFTRGRSAAGARPKPASDDITAADACEAYIDAQTRLPYFMRKGVERYIYKFEQPPDAILTLPADVKSVVEREQVRLRTLALKPPAG